MRGKHSIQFKDFLQKKDAVVTKKINNSYGLSRSSANNQLETVGTETAELVECVTKIRRYKQLCFSFFKKQT